MKRKQILFAITIGLLMVTLSACGKSVNNETTTPQASIGVNTTTPQASSLKPTDVKASVLKNGKLPIKLPSGLKVGKAHTTPSPVKVYKGTQSKLAPVVDVAVYADYDNKILTGKQVSAAITLFKGKCLAILVATQMVMDGTTAINTPDGNIAIGTPTAGVSGLTKVLNSAGKDMSDKLTFINYGAILKGTKGKAMLTFDKGYLMSKDGLDGVEASFVTNTEIENVTKDGMAERLSDYLHMQTYLVKDSKGAVIGIACYAVK